MKLFKAATCVCFQNFRKWAVNYRVWIIVIFAIILTREFTKDIANFSAQIDIPVSPWMFPFLFTQRYVKLLFFFPLILLFCDAPFIDENEPYVIFRSGRKAWSFGQMGYIFLSSAVYFLFLILCTLILNIANLEFTSEWGKVLGTLAKTNASQIMGVKITISSTILHYFTPIQAMWFSFFLSWLTGIFLGLLIYVINSVSNTRTLGVLSASFFLLLDATFRTDKLWWFSPVSWCNLTRIDIGGLSQKPTITFIYCAFAVIITGLTILSVYINKKQAIHILPPV
jgi:hypothetical protein